MGRLVYFEIGAERVAIYTDLITRYCFRVVLIHTNRSPRKPEPMSTVTEDARSTLEEVPIML